MKALDLDFIRRVIVTTGVLSVLALLFISVYYDWRFGLGVFFGSVWGIANLHFLRELIVSTITPEEIDRKKVIFFALVKFPGLYFAGYLILKYGNLSILSFLFGFTLLFAVAVLKVLGRLLNEWLENSGSPHNMNSMVR